MRGSTIITLAGVPVTEDDARSLVTTLVTDDTESALELANRLQTCLELGVEVMTLEAFERSTLLAVLGDPPDNSLAELHGALARDQRDPPTLDSDPEEAGGSAL